MEIRQTELLRYLGWKGQEFDETLQNKLEEAAKRCLELARPRCVVKKFTISHDMRIADDFALEGQDVAAHLAGCTELYLFAATVGRGRGAGNLAPVRGGKGERRPAFRQRRDLRRRKLCGRDLRGSASGRNIRPDRTLFLRIRGFSPFRPTEDPATSFRRHQDRPVLGRKFSLVPAEIGDGAHRRDKAKRARKKTRVRQ